MLINKKLLGSLDTFTFPGLSYIGIVPYTIHVAKRGSPVWSFPTIQTSLQEATIKLKNADCFCLVSVKRNWDN